MTVGADALRKLTTLGLTGEQLAGVLEVVADMQEEAAANATGSARTRRQERNRRYYETHSEELKEKRRLKASETRLKASEQASEIKTQGSPPKKRKVPPKNPPKEKNTPSPISVERARDDAELASEFEHFWLAYPNKVGKPDAVSAYLKARRGVRIRGKPPRPPATPAQISDGLERYIRTKPPDRQWLNPATFLNQERYDDQPADHQPANRNRDTASPYDAILGAVAEQFAPGPGEAERVSDPQGGVRADEGTAGADPEPSFDLDPAAYRRT